MSEERADHVRDLARALVPDAEPDTVWTNPLGGRTLRLAAGGQVRYLKVAPTTVPPSHLPDSEAERLAWVGDVLPVPPVQGSGRDRALSWLLTGALPGRPASDRSWRFGPEHLVHALGRGMRDFHDRLAGRVAGCPWRWDIAHRLANGRHGERAAQLAATAPVEDDPVVAHGDFCAPNILLTDDGEVSGYVDLGKLGVADRAADLGTMQWSLEYNGHGELCGDLLTAYGWQGDPARVQWYRDFYTLV